MEATTACGFRDGEGQEPCCVGVEVGEDGAATGESSCC